MHSALRAAIAAAIIALASTSCYAGPDKDGGNQQIRLLNLWKTRDCARKPLRYSCEAEAARLASTLETFVAEYTASGCLEKETPPCLPRRAKGKKLIEEIKTFLNTFGISMTKGDLAATKGVR